MANKVDITNSIFQMYSDILRVEMYVLHIYTEQAEGSSGTLDMLLLIFL